jgi:hypothetical protein
MRSSKCSSTPQTIAEVKNLGRKEVAPAMFDSVTERGDSARRKNRIWGVILVLVILGVVGAKLAGLF